MTLYKGTFIFSNDSAQGRSESLYSSSNSTTLMQMLTFMKQLAPLRMALSYGPVVKNPLAQGVLADNPLKMVYIRVEDELTRRDGQLMSVDYEGGYVPSAAKLRAGLPLGNWPIDWNTMHQWYGGPGVGPGQWALEYMCGIPMDATGYDGSQNPTLDSNWTAAYNRYFAAIVQRGLGFKSNVAARAAGGAPAYLQPTKPSVIAFEAGANTYGITMPLGWTGPANQSSLNSLTANIRGQVSLRFLNGQRPVAYFGVNTAGQQQYVLARGRWPQVAWDNNGTFSIAAWLGVSPTSFTFLGMHRRKAGRVPFVPRGRARTNRP